MLFSDKHWNKESTSQETNSVLWSQTQAVVTSPHCSAASLSTDTHWAVSALHCCITRSWGYKAVSETPLRDSLWELCGVLDRCTDGPCHKQVWHEEKEPLVKVGYWQVLWDILEWNLIFSWAVPNLSALLKFLYIKRKLDNTNVLTLCSETLCACVRVRACASVCICHVTCGTHSISLK